MQRSFLHGVGLTNTTVQLHFNLAPLPSRRDIAVLGLLRTCALGIAPPQLCHLFPLDLSTPQTHATRLATARHHLQLCDPPRWKTLVHHSSLHFRYGVCSQPVAGKVCQGKCVVLAECSSRCVERALCAWAAGLAISFFQEHSSLITALRTLTLLVLESFFLKSRGGKIPAKR